MKASTAILSLTLLASGIALACEIIVHSFTISVSDQDIATAAVQGHQNPARAAAVAALDAAGVREFTAAGWRASNFISPVTYIFESGANIVTENKECGKTLTELLPPVSTYSGSGSIGVYRWYGGRLYGAGTCLYGCGIRYGTVGEVIPL